MDQRWKRKQYLSNGYGLRLTQQNIILDSQRLWVATGNYLFKLVVQGKFRSLNIKRICIYKIVYILMAKPTACVKTVDTVMAQLEEKIAA